MGHQYTLEAIQYDFEEKPLKRPHRIVLDCEREYSQEELRRIYERAWAKPNSFARSQGINRREFKRALEIKPGDVEIGRFWGC